MKTIKSQRKCLSTLAAILVTVAGIFGLASCETYDLDERMPSQLGSSIYDYLVENHFDTYVKLIDDTTLISGNQSYHDILSRTGSKTLFVADEEAVQRFFASGVFKKGNGENVSCYEDLSQSQKKMLLFGAMLDNVYQSANLSSREDENGGDPKKGETMRRVSQQVEIYDTVTYIASEDMPDNPYWDELRQTEGIWCMTDATKRPKIIFTPKFLSVNGMKDKDYDFLFHHNDNKHRRPDEVSVNGVSMKEGLDNQRCMNGFIHVMEDVVYPLPNMAEMLDKTENTVAFDAIINRFCAPYVEFPYDGDNDGSLHTAEFNKIYGKNVNQIYQKRFFSVRSQPTPSAAYGDSLYMTSNRKENVKDFLLKFDIGWNSYFTTSGGMAANIALQRDMAVMIVPNDDAMIYWWNNSNPLKQRYGKKQGNVSTAAELVEDMENVPNLVIKELVNNCLLTSLVNSVPSRFSNILDDGMEVMDITEDDIDDVKICCNGALYITNRVISPTSYKSVAFPVLVNKNLEVLNWAIDELNFRPYLNSVVSQYSFFIPEGGKEVDGVENCLVYLSPIIKTVAEKYNEVYVFHFDEKTKTVTARTYYADENGDPDVSRLINANVGSVEIKNILNDLLNAHIVLGHVEGNSPYYNYGEKSMYSYFKTKGGGVVKFDLAGSKRSVSGGYQLVSDKEPANVPANVTYVYNQKDDVRGNGRSYILDKPLYSSPMTVDEIVTDNDKYPDFATFGELLESTRLTLADPKYGGKNITIFNTYNYTVYVPGNDALNEMISDKRIICGEDYATLSDIYALDKLQADYEAKHGSADGFEDYCLNIGIKLHQKMLDIEGQEPTHEDSIYTPELYLADLADELDNFVKYHIQDNSIYVSSDYYEKNNGVVNYETSYMNYDKGVFSKLAIGKDNESGTIVIQDYKLNGDPNEKTHKVVLKENCYNIMCREYQYATEEGNTGIYTSSFAVVHLIDSPLNYGDVSRFGYGNRSLYFDVR